MPRQQSSEEAAPPETAGPLDSPVESLPGIGPKRAQLLANLGLRTVRDFLFHLPRDYRDRRDLTPIAEAAEGDTVTIEGEVVKARMIPLRRRMSIAEITVRDATGEIKATWFGRGFLARAFPPGTRLLLTGLVGQYKGLALKNPDYESLTGDDDDLLNTGRIVPIYRLTEGVTQRMLRRWVRTALDSLSEGPEDVLPESLRLDYGFPVLEDALRTVHFPGELEDAHKARERFAYEELLAIQIAVLASRARRRHEEKGLSHVTEGPALDALRAALPFDLTAPQARAVSDVLTDMRSPRPMARLIQGDVGCGKTVVALHAITAASASGFQTALMAPTEILAEQHYLTLRPALEALGYSVALLTGSTKQATKARDAIANGDVNVIVGTHALIQQSTAFHRLGLVIVDEQHRFGVVQRSRLAEKGILPDVLHLTATPIPRTLALTVYGGMDISVIDELPPGRLPVKTKRITPAKIPTVIKHILRQAERGFQTYFICPLVEESEKVELSSVTTHFEEFSRGPLSSIRSALIHGRLSPEEKDGIMTRFKNREIDILFSTTVIEVGIDVPTATTIVIEDAGQFGLTQLHQLRGRVGRGTEQSHCFLLGKAKTEDAKRRLDVLCETNDGFKIAEEDMQLRGPGEFYGVRQAGLTDLRAADLLRDIRLLDQARRDAQRILEQDPHLTTPQWKPLATAAQPFSQISA